MLSKTSAYVRSYDRETKWMYFFTEDDELLEKYNSIWNKFSNSIEKEFDCKHINNKFFLKTKIWSYSQEVKDFYDDKIPKLGSSYTCLAVILINFFLQRMKTIILCEVLRTSFV